MSPAGLKGVAEEAGRELVVVCGHNMGDIFRRNAFNLGLHVVQSPEAVADARDGDVFSFDPATRRLTNETRGKGYEPVPLSLQGGRDPQERRHFRGGPPGARGVDRAAPRDPVARSRRRAAPDDDGTDRVGASRRQGRARRAGDDAPRLRRPAPGVRRHGSLRDPHLQPDHRRRDDLPAPGRGRQRPLRLHGQGDRRPADGDRPGVRHAATGSRSPTTRRRATGSSTSTSRSRGWCSPVSSSPAPTRTAAPTARTGPSASASARRRSGSAGRPGTSTSRRPGRAASSFAGACSPGSRARTSCSSCCAAGARSRRRGCRSSSWTRDDSSRWCSATRSPT